LEGSVFYFLFVTSPLIENLREF